MVQGVRALPLAGSARQAGAPCRRMGCGAGSLNLPDWSRDGHRRRDRHARLVAMKFSPGRVPWDEKNRPASGRLDASRLPNRVRLFGASTTTRPSWSATMDQDSAGRCRDRGRSGASVGRCAESGETRGEDGKVEGMILDGVDAERRVNDREEQLAFPTPPALRRKVLGVESSARVEPRHHASAQLNRSLCAQGPEHSRRAPVTSPGQQRLSRPAVGVASDDRPRTFDGYHPLEDAIRPRRDRSGMPPTCTDASSAWRSSDQRTSRTTAESDRNSSLTGRPRWPGQCRSRRACRMSGLNYFRRGSTRGASWSPPRRERVPVRRCRSGEPIAVQRHVRSFRERRDRNLIVRTSSVALEAVGEKIAAGKHERKIRVSRARLGRRLAARVRLGIDDDRSARVVKEGREPNPVGHERLLAGYEKLPLRLNEPD